MSSKKDQFLTACRNQKLDTVRWGINAGGQQPSSRDENGMTALMICASLNKHKALQMLCDWTRRARMREQLDLTDGNGDGVTALMMAAKFGHEESCSELLDAGCDFKVKCGRGKTAADYARAEGKNEKLARLIERGGEESEEEEEEGEEEEDANAVEGETATQRSKRKKKEMEAKERGGGGAAVAAKESKKGESKKDKDEEEDDGKEAPEPKWPEVKKAMKERAKELTISRKLEDGEELDLAMFYCSSVNTLKIECGKSLTSLPKEIKKLKGLLTLIVSENGLTSLPKEIGKLKNLRVLECEGNKLEALPEELSKLQNLEILRLGRNQIKDLSALKKMNNLVTLVVDNNRLRTLDDFDLGSKSRLITLSANNNEIVDAPSDIGKCTLLTEILLNKNNIEELPGEWGELKEKKVREIDLDDNPIKDSKIKKMMGKSDKFVKELLTYVRKNCKTGLAKKAGNAVKSSKKKKEESEDEDEEKEEKEEKKEETTGDAGKEEQEEQDGDVSETESELEERMSKMSKKEKEKFKRKLVEKQAEKARKVALEKRLKEDAENLKRMEELVISGAGNNDDGDDSDEPIDSDDEEALLARKQKQKQKSKPTFMYALTDEQRKEAEKAEAKRLFEKEKAEREAAEALKRKEEDAKNKAKDLNAVKLDGDAGKDGRYTWSYANGKFDRSVTKTPPKTEHTIEVVIPKLICGRLIGKGGATIKSVSERSKVVRVNIDETKGGAGNSLLVVQGSESAMESARMLFNNAM